MSEKLILPPNLLAARQPNWKALALAGWTLALILGGLHLQRMQSPALTSPSLPPPPAAQAMAPTGVENVRALLKRHQPQQALAEIARVWTICQQEKLLPPPELPELFAQAIRDLSQVPANPKEAERPLPPQPRGGQPPPPLPPPPPRTPGCHEEWVEPYTDPYPGPLPGPGYPRARPRPTRPESQPTRPGESGWGPPPNYPPPPSGNFEPPPGFPGPPPEGQDWPGERPPQRPPPPPEAPSGGRPSGY